LRIGIIIPRCAFFGVKKEWFIGDLFLSEFLERVAEALLSLMLLGWDIV